MLAQQLLIVVGAILTAAIRMMDAARGRLPQRDSHLQRPDCQVAFHPVADRPTDDTPGMQVEDHGEIEPPFTRPNITDV